MSSTPQADLVITGRVATLAGGDGFAWQPGIAVAGGRVVAVGDDSTLEPLVGPGTERWRLREDMLVMPGITDAHLHLMNLVLGERQVDLTGADLDAALELIGTRHREMAATGDVDGWLLGHGWSLHSLGKWPDAALLESVAPQRPIALYAHDHHSRWVSRRALELCGVDIASGDPDGGLIRRDAEGRPAGILHEVASALVDPAIPKPSADELGAGLERVSGLLHGLGLTGCHDPGELTSESEIGRGPVFYREIAASGGLPLRVHSSVRAPQLERAIELGFCSGQGVDPDPRLDPASARRTARYRMGWLKLFADGSLGSRSAALLAPYDDAEINPPTGGPTGMVLTDSDELAALIERAASARISGQIHAIGDAAVRTALDVFAWSLSASGRGAWDRRKLMPRIEHAQLVDPADVPRFGALGVAASLQPVHLRSDATAARAAWGDRSQNTFPLRALVDGGALIPIGTDAPVEPADPWPGIAVAVARRDPFDMNEPQTGAQHAISLARAIRAACLDPALVAGEGELGRLLPGYRADLLVVPAGAFREPFMPADFASTRPHATLIDGDVVHRLNAFDP